MRLNFDFTRSQHKLAIGVRFTVEIPHIISSATSRASIKDDRNCSRENVPLIKFTIIGRTSNCEFYFASFGPFATIFLYFLHIFSIKRMVS